MSAENHPRGGTAEFQLVLVGREESAVEDEEQLVALGGVRRPVGDDEPADWQGDAELLLDLPSSAFAREVTGMEAAARDLFSELAEPCGTVVYWGFSHAT